MRCPFCDSEKLQPRTFYKDGHWLAFLAAPPHTRGHTILAAVGRPGNCPRDPDEKVLSGICGALATVIQALKALKPKPKDVLFASLRGSVRHFHLHLIPLRKNEESAWRNGKADEDFYAKGHLLEYLGFLEHGGDRAAATCRKKKGWSEDKQRKNAVKQLGFQFDLAVLRGITGYGRA